MGAAEALDASAADALLHQSEDKFFRRSWASISAIQKVVNT